MILKSILTPLLKKDPYADLEGGYSVRSLYFDDYHDSALCDKDSGILSRRKYRIRCYNNSDNVLKLECKYKTGEFVSKSSALLTRLQYSSIISGDMEFLMEQKGVLREFYIEHKKALLKPKVIVDYRREAYIDKFCNLRITFDTDLCGAFNTSDIFNESVLPFHVFHNPIVILELKFNRYIPSHISDIINSVSHEASAISKYTLCREVERTTACNQITI